VSHASSYLLVELRVEDEPPPAGHCSNRRSTLSRQRDRRRMGRRTLAHDLCSQRGRRHRGRLHGWTWGQTGFVQTLWVREVCAAGARREPAGYGGAEAARRGCREVHLDTPSYQAPGFYRHRGYEVIGELPGWPDHTDSDIPSKDTVRLPERRCCGGPGD
jgi:hypothetical protein